MKVAPLRTLRIIRDGIHSVHYARPAYPPSHSLPNMLRRSQRAHTRAVGVVPSLFGRPVLGLPAGGDIAALEPEVCFLGCCRRDPSRCHNEVLLTSLAVLSPSCRQGARPGGLHCPRALARPRRKKQPAFTDIQRHTTSAKPRRAGCSLLHTPSPGNQAAQAGGGRDPGPKF